MEHTIFNSKDPCADFRDSLDLWLGHELDADCSEYMQAHHDACAACQMETRLAREVDAITAALPAHVDPARQLLVDTTTRMGQRAALHRNMTPDVPFITRLLAAWRQPLVFVPALALVLATLLAVQLRLSDTSTDSQIVIIDGREYTQAEIMKATEDLKIALRYLDKYGSYPATVVQSGLEPGRLPPPVANDGDSPAI